MKLMKDWPHIRATAHLSTYDIIPRFTCATASARAPQNLTKKNPPFSSHRLLNPNLKPSPLCPLSTLPDLASIPHDTRLITHELPK